MMFFGAFPFPLIEFNSLVINNGIFVINVAVNMIKSVLVNGVLLLALTPLAQILAKGLHPDDAHLRLFLS